MAGTDGIRQWLADLGSVLYPRLCEVCGTALAHGEEIMCLECRYNMPKCRFHTQPFNHMHRRLAGHAPIEKAAGYFYYYRGNDYTRLIQAAKYNGRPHIARSLSRDFAAEIAPDGFFDGIDTIIPVPLHKHKLRSRGYNQSFHIALGIRDVTRLPVADNLVAARSHGTQTRRNAFDRWVNSRHIYSVMRPDELAGRHILIVDDVLTTGATLLACCEALHTAVPDATISVLTLAVAQLR